MWMLLVLPPGWRCTSPGPTTLFENMYILNIFLRLALPRLLPLLSLPSVFSFFLTSSLFRRETKRNATMFVCEGRDAAEGPSQRT